MKILYWTLSIIIWSFWGSLEQRGRVFHEYSASISVDMYILNAAFTINIYSLLKYWYETWFMGSTHDHLNKHTEKGVKINRMTECLRIKFERIQYFCLSKSMKWEGSLICLSSRECCADQHFEIRFSVLYKLRENFNNYNSRLRSGITLATHVYIRL